MAGPGKRVLMANVFVTVGTHRQQFDRLIRKIDSMALREQTKDEFFVQYGNSGYVPSSAQGKKFLAPAEVRERIKWADVILSHGGAGSIIGALAKKKPLIVIPRLKRFGEHTDNHQIELAKALEREGKAIVIYSTSRVPEAIQEAKRFKPNPSRQRAGLVKAINNYLDSL